MGKVEASQLSNTKDLNTAKFFELLEKGEISEEEKVSSTSDQENVWHQINFELLQQENVSAEDGIVIHDAGQSWIVEFFSDQIIMH